MQVNIHRIYNSRIGHFATNTELSVLSAREKKAISGRRQIDIFCLESEESSNLFLEKMWRREVFCVGKSWGWLVNDISRRIKSTNFYHESTREDLGGLMIREPTSLTFNDDEKLAGKFFFLDIFSNNFDKFVCLNIRDASYLDKSTPIGWHKNRDWSYHTYRDSDIDTYVEAAEALAEMGYIVFRMGAIVKEPLLSKHPKVIDYATNGMRTEFLDIFLGAHCTFCVSTGSGWDDIPTIFRRPLMYVNYLPYFSMDASRELLIYPKNLVDVNTKAPLNLDEIIGRNIQTCYNSHDYEAAGVKIKDLNSNQLVEAVTEMAQRVEGTFVETPKQKEMQAKLNHILSTHSKLQPTPNHYPIRAEFASSFLSNNPNFLD